jgi:hypothetical protein
MTPGNDPVAERSARRSDAQFYVKRQGGVPARPIFLWWLAFFYGTENTEKSGKCSKIVQAKCVGHLVE